MLVYLVFILFFHIWFWCEWHFFIMFLNVILKWYIIYTLFLFIVYSPVWVTLFLLLFDVFLATYYSYCLLCGYCLIDCCWCEFHLYVYGFQSGLECQGSRGSGTMCLSNGSQRYCLAIVCVGFMCLLFLMITYPVFVMHIVYDLLCLGSPFSTIVPWVHGPPSSHWTTPVDPIGIKA